MRVVVATPPEPVVDLALAKSNLRVDHAEDDALISLAISAATRGLDGPDGWLGRALGRQTLKAVFTPSELAFNHCLAGRFDVPFPPTRSQDEIELTSLTYELNGVVTTVDPALYRLDATGRRLWLNPRAVPWGPFTSDVAPCDVVLTYDTGTPVPSGGALAPVADEVRYAILLLVSALYANREADVIDARAVVAENPAVPRLLNTLRVWR